MTSERENRAPELAHRPAFMDVPRELGPSIVLPFQFVLADWAGPRLWVDRDVSTSPQLITLAMPFRFAELESLEVVLFPRHGCIQFPATVEMRFTAADIAPNPDDMLGHPGSMSFALGGANGALANVVQPVPLGSFSPLVKAPILSTDRVRVALLFWQNTTVPVANNQAGNRPPLVTAVLRGTLRLGYPSNG